MHTAFMLQRFRAAAASPAIIWRDRLCTYDALHSEVQRSLAALADLRAGTVVSLEADFSPRSIAMLLALIEHRAIIVPLTAAVEAKKPRFREIAQVEVEIRLSEDDEIDIRSTGRRPSHALFEALRTRGNPGLILFSSGSTGDSKAAVHDLVPMLEKFHLPRKSVRAITFLLFDHIGGLNTLLYVLSNAGCIVTVGDRQPETVCAAIERYRVQLLPTSPTFMNLLLASEAYRHHDLSSLETVTYGTEVMPESTLQRFRAAFPSVSLQQTYGLSELGILRSKSRSSDSLWVKVGGEGFGTRIVDGKLEIKARSAMLGYLNAPSPFTDDGWFKTGDAVEQDGEYLRILGRESELINVGGEKVFPAEIESVLQAMEGVEEVVVRGEPNPMTGQMVAARVRLSTSETLAEFRSRMRVYCRDKLARFKIPQKVELVSASLHGERFKKSRRA